MKSSVAIRTGLTLFGTGATYGLAVPALVSAASDIAVIGGIALAGLIAPALIGTQVRKVWLHYKSEQAIAQYHKEHP